MIVKILSGYVSQYSSQWMMSFSTMLPPIITQWILAFGFWNDGGKWVDSQSWND